MAHQKIQIGLKHTRHGYRTTAVASEIVIVIFLCLVFALICPYFLSVFMSIIVPIKKKYKYTHFTNTDTLSAQYYHGYCMKLFV